MPVTDNAAHNIALAYKRGGVPKETASFYDEWAETGGYEKHLSKDLYKGPEMAAQTVADYFPSAEQRATVKVLDVAAGTGFVAEHLRTFGFKNVDALDPSEKMMEKARKKNLYKHYMMAFIDENPLPTLPDTYDCAVSSGGMGEGHIPYYGLEQLIRIVKPGGLISIVMREEYLKHSQYEDKLEPYMDTLESDGKWTRLGRIVVPEYCGEKTGLIYKYKVL